MVDSLVPREEMALAVKLVKKQPYLQKQPRHIPPM
jgi:hypothetical protein